MTLRTKENDSESDNSNSNENDEFEISIGDRVVDTDTTNGSPARVVDLPDATAAEFEIEALDQTVAECNPDQPSDVAVVGIQFEKSNEPGVGGPVYHYPATRVTTIDEEWKPEPPKTPAQRAREERIEEQREKFEVFAGCVEYLGRYSEIAADWFVKEYEPYVQPTTRGDCCHSKADEYRPNTPRAICCWECNGGGRRPAKYYADDPVPPSAPCRMRTVRDPSDVLDQWVYDRVAPAIDVDRMIDRAPNSAYDGLRRDAEALCSSSQRRRRAAVLRIAYEATVGGVLDEDYDHSRTIAYLRDLGVDTDDVLPGGDPYLSNGGGSA